MGIAKGMNLYASFASDALRDATESSDPSTRILALNRAIHNAEACLAAEVKELRGDGVTWQQVGDYLGTTRQAAQKRFGGGGR